MFRENAKTRALEFFRAKSSGHDVITALTPEDHEASIAAADTFIHFTGAHINFGYYAPHYNHATDHICMPYRHMFVRDHLFYTVSFHELLHWSGNSKRLNRQRTYAMNPRDAYNLEEFVAQQGATLLQDHFGIATDSFDLDYFTSYSFSAEEAESMMEKGHTLADRAVDYLLNLSERNAQRA